MSEIGTIERGPTLRSRLASLGLAILGLVAMGSFLAYLSDAPLIQRSACGEPPPKHATVHEYIVN